MIIVLLGLMWSGKWISVNLHTCLNRHSYELLKAKLGNCLAYLVTLAYLQSLWPFVQFSFGFWICPKRNSFSTFKQPSMKNSSSSLENTTNLSASDCSIPLAHGFGLLAANSVGALVGTFGNFLVCAAVLYTSPRLRRCSNYLLVSLAIADLIVTMVCEPLVVGIVAKKTFFNDCASNLELAYAVSANFSCSASLLHLAAISIDRFLAVIFPLRHGRIMKSYGLKIMLIVVWGVAAVFASLRVPFLKETAYLAALMFIIGYFLSIGCYLSIAISVFFLRRRNKQASRQGRTVRISVGNKAERRLAFTLAIVIGVFTACWFPAIVVFFVAGKSLVKMYGTAYMWIRTLALLNSAMNFFIYSARIRDFRDAFAIILRKILRVV